MGLKILQSSGKNPPPWESSSPLWPRELPPPTQRPSTLPTCTNLTSTYASGTANTPSARATTGQSSSGPSWNMCSSSGTISSPPMTQLSTFSMPHRSSSPCTTRRMPSEVRPSLISDRSPQYPFQLEQVSTSPSAWENTDYHPPP